MTQGIKARLSAVPFVPFVVCTSDGKEYPVPHPDFAFVSPGGTRVDVHDKDDISTRLPIPHISGLRDAPDWQSPARSAHAKSLLSTFALVLILVLFLVLPKSGKAIEKENEDEYESERTDSVLFRKMHDRL